MKQGMKKLTQRVLVTMAIIGTAVSLVPATASAVVTPKDEVTSGITAAGGSGSTSADLPKLVQSIIGVLLFVAGAVAVIMIILGAIRYITSNGDQANVKAAKDTILYSVIGLVVAMLAYAIVQFIVSKL